MWSLAAGNLPAGLTLNTSTGTISGRATVLGAYAFTVRVTDGHSPAATATRSLSITVSK